MCTCACVCLCMPMHGHEWVCVCTCTCVRVCVRACRHVSYVEKLPVHRWVAERINCKKTSLCMQLLYCLLVAVGILYGCKTGTQRITYAMQGGEYHLMLCHQSPGLQLQVDTISPWPWLGTSPSYMQTHCVHGLIMHQYNIHKYIYYIYIYILQIL